jgi:outer membrane protein OmpA-like peptidoglycan-associated protein
MTIKQLGLFMFILALSTNIHAIQSKIKQETIKETPALIKADAAYQDFMFSIAAENYEAYLKATNSSPKQVLTKLADCYWQMRDYTQALRVYKLLYTEGADGATKQDQRRVAELYARNEEYTNAYKWLSTVNGYQAKADVFNSKEKLSQMMKDSASWKVSFSNINTQYREFSPFLLNNELFFSSNKPIPTSENTFGWDGNNFTHLWKFPLSEVDAGTENKIMDSSFRPTTQPKTNDKKLANAYELGDNSLTKRAQLTKIEQTKTAANSNPIGKLVEGLNNISFNASTIAIDKNNHVYFSSNYTKTDKLGVNRIGLNEGLYSSATGISSIKALPFGDSNAYSAMHPAVNSDGTVLVFSSDKANGRGGYDLYYVTRSDVNKPWGAMQPFSSIINTVGNEVFPSINSKGDLYFSSDNLPGLGGLDIFYIPLKDALAGKGAVKHMSFPVNSPCDDFGITQDTTGLKGYFTSDRFKSEDNIYSYQFHNVVKKEGKHYIWGRVIDEVSKEPIPNATVFLLNKKINKVFISKTDEKGTYSYMFSQSSDVVIKAVEKDHSSNCFVQSFEVKPCIKDSIIALNDLPLARFKVGYKWKLDNIHYDYDKYFIRADAKPILDSVLRVLNRFPIKVELSSHTDCRGKTAYNDRLSQRRAEAAVAYLIQNGIEASRITAKGYGERQLLNRCADGVKCSEEEHQANRRTEIKVTGLTDEGTKLEIDLDKYTYGQQLDKSDLPAGFFDKCK